MGKETTTIAVPGPLAERLTVKYEAANAAQAAFEELVTLSRELLNAPADRYILRQTPAGLAFELAVEDIPE